MPIFLQSFLCPQPFLKEKTLNYRELVQAFNIKDVKTQFIQEKKAAGCFEVILSQSPPLQCASVSDCPNIR